MSKIVFLLIAVGIISFASGKVRRIDEHELHFLNFIKTHGKNYSTQEEHQYRFGIFKENLKKINKWNAESNTTRFGINKFADLTFEEFQRQYTGLKLDDTMRGNAVKYTPVGNAPDELDYRKLGYVTRVKSQGCGDCYIFSTIGKYKISITIEILADRLQNFALFNQIFMNFEISLFFCTSTARKLQNETLTFKCSYRPVVAEKKIC